MPSPASSKARFIRLAETDRPAISLEIDGASASALVAHTAGIPIENVGRLRSQAPVKPLLMDVQS